MTTEAAPTPTREQFLAYEQMFAFFNQSLFGGDLPACILNFSRRSKTYGFFAPERWERDATTRDVRHEISLNPSCLKTRPTMDVAGTLVHEMVHLWQQERGTPSRTGYHNKEWAAKMLEVGLVPSATGLPGGATTGQRVSHYVAKDGPFEKAFLAMPPDHSLPWGCDEPERARAKRAKDDEGSSEGRNKVKYVCRSCGAKVWGKPGLSIACGTCKEAFEPL